MRRGLIGENLFNLVLVKSAKTDLQSGCFTVRICNPKKIKLLDKV